MEQERNKKRAREDDEGENEIGSSFENHNNNNAKKRDVHGRSFMIKEEEEEEEKVEENGCFKGWDSSHLAVFDFPWLKDGVMSNSEDWFLDFEHNFLQSSHTSSKNGHGCADIFEECGLCDIPEASTSHVPEDVWHPFEDNGLELEAEDLDCIWGSLLNKPI